MSGGFVPPAYPYERLASLRSVAAAIPGGAIDCSIGTPCDPPPPEIAQALAGSGSESGYPPSIGTVAYREAASGWLSRRLRVRVDPETEIAACIGTKEFVASLPRYLSLRHPERDTVLYPAVSYPTYAMGATLAGCRAVPVAVDEDFRIDLASISDEDADRALCVWVNTPGNPAGALDDLGAAARWGRTRGVLVVSDECYAEFTWEGSPCSILAHGSDGVLALHSLSKRSNMAGVRAGFYAGDADVVGYLRETRKHAGCMVPGPVQAAAVAAWADQAHVDIQRGRYLRRLELLVSLAEQAGASQARIPAGGFYVWARAPDDDAWEFADRLARTAGVIVSPGEFYSDQTAPASTPDPTAFVRIAAVQPEQRLQLALQRLDQHTN